LEIAFAKRSIRQLCENERTAQRLLGKKAAEKLKARLADLSAADYVKDLVVGRPREAHGGRRIVIDLCDEIQLVFCVNHNVAPTMQNGAVDWSRVNRVKIEKIGRARV